MSEDRQIALGNPVLGHQELDRISDVFDSGWVLNGPETEAFEEDFSEYVGTEHAVSVVNCTAGMELAFKALGLDGKTVILPGLAFVANGIALLENDIQPLFVDVKPDTYNVDPAAVRERAEDADAVFLLHYAGHPAEMDEVLDIAEEHDLRVIEDAAHALGAGVDDRNVGSFGDATVFSFGPLKMITTAMGGMVATPHEEVANRIESLRSYGMDEDAWSREERQYSWRYSIPTLGHNFRLSDVAAAMGRAQLDRIDEFIESRRSLAAEYTGGFDRISGISPPVELPPATHTYLYYVIRVERGFPLSRNQLAETLEKRGVEVSVHWDPPLYKHEFLRDSVSEVDFPVTERLSQELLTLPMHPNLTTEDVEYVLDVVAEESETVTANR